MTDELKPCPFCGDKMGVTKQLFYHKTQRPDCPISKQAFVNEMADIWNARAEQTGDMVSKQEVLELVRNWNRHPKTGEMHETSKNIVEAIEAMPCSDDKLVEALESWGWYASLDEENYTEGPFDTRDEAIESLEGAIAPPPDIRNEFYILEAKKADLKFNVERLIDDQYLDNDDLYHPDFDHCNPDRLENYKDADQELQVLLDNWMLRWKHTFVQSSYFSEMRNAEVINYDTLKDKGAR